MHENANFTVKFLQFLYCVRDGAYEIHKNSRHTILSCYMVYHLCAAPLEGYRQTFVAKIYLPYPMSVIIMIIHGSTRAIYLFDIPLSICN